ncbi:hypothetical protein JCM11491_005376 [Sporobolomyces phaffii]
MSSYLSRECPAENTIGTDQSSFFDGRWDAHEKGWVIAGATALVSVVISLISILKHARNYYVPKQQRQIIRILWMPAVYGVVSFFSYRFFRAYTYYSVAVVAYEALVLAAFLMLLLQYVGDSSMEQKALLRQKEKSKIPIPFCCIRFRPSKPYFLHALKWSVLQYSLLRPLISVIEIICQAYDKLCPTHYSVYFAEVYLDAVDFVSISVALYGLIVFYALVKEQLAGKKPLAKFLCIKFVVMVLFYQAFIFSVLQSHGVIKATEFWTATNVADGLSALCTCCEMVIFSFWFMWAFNWSEYTQLRGTQGDGKPTSVFWALLDSFNYWDFLREGGKGIKFLFDYITNKPGTRSGSKKKKKTRASKRRHEKGEDDEKRDQLDHPGGGTDNDDEDRDDSLGHNHVGLDFEKAFEAVRNDSDAGSGAGPTAEEEEESAIYPEGRSGYAGVGARDRFAERTDLGRPAEVQRHPYHASSMAQAAFERRPVQPPPVPSASAPFDDAYRPLPHDHLTPSPQHPYVSASAPLNRPEDATMTREDWRPYTPPNVSEGIPYRPVR